MSRSGADAKPLQRSGEGEKQGAGVGERRLRRGGRAERVYRLSERTDKRGHRVLAVTHFRCLRRLTLWLRLWRREGKSGKAEREIAPMPHIAFLSNAWTYCYGG